MVSNSLADRLAAIINQLQAVHAEMVEPLPRLPLEAEKRLAAGVCLLCNKRIAKTETPLRGTHEKCYRRIKRRIANGELTDSDAVRSGIWAAKTEAGRKPKDSLDKLIDTVAETVQRDNERARAKE